MSPTMHVEFENENLIAVLKHPSGKDEVKAVCPDLIQVRHDNLIDVNND